MQQYRKNLGKVSLTTEGAWNRDKDYEILSIVYEEHTQHGFISRKEVPVGIDINNKEYWMPLNVSGYVDNNMIILNQKTSETAIKSYTLEEAIKSIASVGRKPGAILGFYNENTDRLDIGGRWELWQYNGVDVADWENVNSWDSIYYNYNKFVGWYRSEEALKKYIPFPEIGCYAYVGSDLNEAVIYRCDRKYAWTNTTEHVWDYIKVIVGGNVTVGENGNWFNNGVDTNIPASIKGENGKTPIIRNNDNVLEVSYDNVTWTKISDEMAAWFRINNNKLEMSRHQAGGWEIISDYIAAWFRWQSQGGQQAFSTGKIQITRDGVTWTDLSGEFVNNLRISRYIGTDESLPTSGIAEGTIYAKGPYYEDTDTNHDYPAYRIWVYAWKGNTLAWVDNGQFTSIAAGIVQETGDGEGVVMSQKAVTEKLSELGSEAGLLTSRVFGLNDTYILPIREIGVHNQKDDRIRVFIPKGTFQFVINKGNTSNEGIGQLFVRYEGDSQDTSLPTYPTIGEVNTYSIDKNVIEIGIYLGASAVTSIGEMEVVIEYNGKNVYDIENITKQIKDRLFNVYSTDGINFNNEEQLVEVLSIINFNTSSRKSIPVQAIPYENMDASYTSHMALLVDEENLTLKLKKYDELSYEDIVVATFHIDGKVVNKIYNSSLPIKIDGEDVYTELQRINDKIEKQGIDIIKDIEEIRRDSGVEITQYVIYDEIPETLDKTIKVTHTATEGEIYRFYWSEAVIGKSYIVLYLQKNSTNVLDVVSKKADTESGYIEFVIPVGGANYFNIYPTGVTAHFTIMKVEKQNIFIEKLYSKESIFFEEGFFYNTLRDENGYITAEKDTANTAYKTAKIECGFGDVFEINAESGTNKALPFTFVDENNKVIVSPIRYGSTGVYHSYVTAPIGAKYLIINSINRFLTSYRLRGCALINDIRELNLQAISQYSNNGIFSTFGIAISSNGGIEPTIVSLASKFTSSNDTKPTIQFKIGDIYQSPTYILGEENRFKYQQFRIPPMVFGIGAEIIVNVPDGCELKISNISATKDFIKTICNGGLDFGAHLGFSGVAPSNTMVAFELASMCGYNSCICNPISSKEGTLYCYHGGQPSLTIDGVNPILYSVEEFHELTDSEINNHKVFGFGTHRNYYSEPIPTMEAFFELCAKTGMKPIYSTHPPLQEGDLLKVKELLIKYNLLDRFTIKSFYSDVLYDAYSVFGDEIYGYTYDIGTASEDLLESTIETFNSIIPQSYRCVRCIEIIEADAKIQYVERIKNNGFKVGVYNMEDLRSGERYQELVNMGVTIFTDDNNCSNGLNW